MVAVEDDHSRARAEDRAAEPAHRLVQAIQPHQPADRRRLAARDDQAVEPVELLGEPDLDRLGTETPQHGGVLAEVPLHGEDADRERLFHASMVTRATRRAGSAAAEPRCRGGVRRHRRRVVRRRPSMPSRTSQKPSNPKPSGNDQALTLGAAGR